MKQNILLSVVGAAILAMGTTASAGGNSLFSSGGESSMLGGLYVGGSYGQATARCMLINQQDSDECTTDGWKAFAGYKFTDNIAVEGTYYNLGKAEETYQHASFGAINATGEATGFGLSGMYSFEVFDNFDVFGKLGAIRWNLEGKAKSAATGATAVEEQAGTSMIYGAGASYKFTDNLAIRGEYERYNAEYQTDLNDSSKTEESDVDILSVGATFSTY